MTEAELAVLSLVIEKPRHGYQIEHVIEERGMREWTEVGFSSIYYLLRKLEKKGLVESRLEEAERGPARKVYHPTPAGEEAFRAGVIEALTVPQRAHSALSLGLTGLPSVSPLQALEAMTRRRDDLAQELARVRELWESQQPLPYFVDGVFEYGLAMIQAEFDWVEEFITKLEAENVQD
jgi:DNA-binding PadR family transcriptional regulator